MAYWLCITNSDNWKVIKKENIWGVADRYKNTIARVRKGDVLIIYGIQEKKDDKIIEPRIYGIFKAESEVFRDSKRIFKTKDEIYPNRIKISPERIPTKPIKFKPLIEKLKFIKNKKKWNTHLFGRAMREIDDEDYKTIDNALNQE